MSLQLRAFGAKEVRKRLAPPAVGP